MADAPLPAAGAEPALRRTPLHEAVLAAGGRMVGFGGWSMAVQFGGLIQEHQAVRNDCGVFDISHMGVLRLRGQAVKDRMQRLVPTDLFRIGPGETCYTVLLNENGGIRDDLMITRRGDGFFAVVNAATASPARDVDKRIAIQIAAALGARVFATAGSAEDCWTSCSSTGWPIATRRNCRAGSASASPWRARWCVSRGCSSSTR